jgi:TetR/AcrR family transcriptional regulator, cholesterol catabolism regulator
MPNTLAVPDESSLSREDSESTRDRILAAAALLFRTHGYRGTTTRAISEVVGILSGSLFHYFKSKDQMLFEVMHEAASSMCMKADAVLASEASPHKQMKGLIRMHLECLLSDKTKVLVFEWRELNPKVKPVITGLRRRYFAIWHGVLEECRKLGLVRSDPHTTQLILNGALSWPATWFNVSGPVSLDQYAHTLQELILSGQQTTDSAR